MTKNSAKKRAARAYKKAHGTTYPEARRAVGARSTGDLPAPAADWTHWSSPWIRRIAGSSTGPEAITCYLCGNSTMIRAFGDVKDDHGRVELYCDNPDCAAREVELIVMRDGHSATFRRADVEALESIAAAAHHQIQTVDAPDSWVAGAVPWVRTADAPATCVFCGEQTCVRSRADVVDDRGRVQLYCDNPRCDVREVELIVMRDGTPRTAGRPDVLRLREIDEGPESRPSASSTGTPGLRVRRIPSPDEKLARRLGH
ncbi:hypothetical protein ACWDTG_26250 [Rhodococcus zopfii]